MSWLVDHGPALFVVLGITAAAFVMAWHFHRRVSFLVYALGAIVLMGLLWIATLYFPSDSKQLEVNVDAMARAVKEGRMDDLFQHISRDFRYREMTRDDLYAKARGAIEGYKVSEIRITAFHVDEIDREKKLARVFFRVSAWEAGSDQPYLFATKAAFVLEGERWKLKTMGFYNPFVNQDQEISLPLP